MKFEIAVLKGDGIGVEVTSQSLKVLKSIGEKFSLDFKIKDLLVGGASIDELGIPLHPDVLKECKSSDCILFGAIGGSKWDNLPSHLRPESGLLALRKSLEVYANIRPIFVFDELIGASTLKKEVIEGVDLIVVRELISGIYFGEPRSKSQSEAFNTMRYTKEEIIKIANYAFKLASKRSKRLCSVDKANVLEVSKLWREVVEEVHANFKDVDLCHQYVDNASMQLIRNPRQFDIILTGNLFGDILSDEASQLTGSIGLLPSASIGDKYALYEPIHGSAPDIAGKDLANPIASILSLAMMLRLSLNLNEAANLIEDVIKKILKQGIRTHDICDFNASKVLGCDEFGSLVAKEVLNAK